MLASSSVNSSDRVASDPVHASQNVAKHSFAVPILVAECSEHTPDKASFMSYAGDLETTSGRPAAAGVPLGDSPLTKMSFSDLEATVRFFERSDLGMPDSFIDSLQVVVVCSDEFDFVTGGNSCRFPCLVSCKFM